MQAAALAAIATHCTETLVRGDTFCLEYVHHVTTAGSLGDHFKCDNHSINQSSWPDMSSSPFWRCGVVSKQLYNAVGFVYFNYYVSWILSSISRFLGCQSSLAHLSKVRSSALRSRSSLPSFETARVKTYDLRGA